MKSSSECDNDWENMSNSDESKISTHFFFTSGMKTARVGQRKASKPRK